MQQENHLLELTKIKSISSEDKIKYLEVNFANEIIFDSEQDLRSLTNKIDKLTGSPYLKTEQEVFILSNYIWPTLIYPFQTAPLKKNFSDVDKIILVHI